MKKVLITGGAGCLGSHMIETVYEHREELGVKEIVVLDMIAEVKWASERENERIKSYVDNWITGSITDAATVLKAVEGCDAVIHCASLVDFGTVPKEALYEVNVKGAEIVLSACMSHESVKALVYSSSLDVACSTDDFEGYFGADESSEYALDNPDLQSGYDVYGMTKTMAERAILDANQISPHLRTAAVRPVGIYGERDTIHIGSVLAAAKDMGPFNFVRMGMGSAVFQHVYAKNCAWMHILAAKQLCEENDEVAGEAFFGIDDTKVVNFFDFFDPYLVAKGYKVPTVRVPMAILYPIAAVAEDIFLFLRKFIPSLRTVKFVLTRRAIQATCVSQWFETDKASRLIGYKPLVGPMEARKRSIAYLHGKTDIFPPGPFTYRPGQYDYYDPGTDYRPDPPLKKKPRSKSRGRSSWYITPMLGAGIVGAAVVATVIGRKSG